MFTKSVLVATLAALASAAPRPLMRRAAVDAYTSYSGDGSVAAGWPATDAWASFEDLWAGNQEAMQNSCSWNGWGEDNTPEEIQSIQDAITTVAGETGVDNRFILSIIMQESKGCVRVPTTDNGVRNPGLMQSHNGSGDCTGISPCPADTVLQMVRDGTAGTDAGDGLQQTLAATSAQVSEDAQAVYAAARMYNSGSVDYADLNDGITSTACYAQDVANRLTGWSLATSLCA